MLYCSMPKNRKPIEPQHKRFIETARALECDEDKERFEEKLGRIARARSPVNGPEKKARGRMAAVTCVECGQIADVSVASGAAQYTFNHARCTQRARPSTSQERFVDSTKCPSLERSIALASERGDI